VPFWCVDAPEMNGEKMTDAKHTHPDEDDQFHDMHDNNALGT